MVPITELDFSCPCCGEDFRSPIRSSSDPPGMTTTDFFTMSAGEQAIHYQVHTCPQCGYSFEEMEEGELRDDVRGFVQDVLTPQVPEGVIPSWKKFEFLALIDEKLGSGFFTLAMLYLHAAWCCYDLNEIELEKHYRKMAIEYFLMETGSAGMDPDLIYLVPYLLGEQYRRIGEKDNAERWYDIVLGTEEEHADSGLFMTLAAQQKISPKEFMGEIIHEER